MRRRMRPVLGVAFTLAFTLAACESHEGGRLDVGDLTFTPGSDVAMTIVSAGVTDERRPFAVFELTDLSADPIDRAGFETSWTLAQLTPDATGGSTYTSLITRPATGELGTTDQPSYETDGDYQVLEGGRVRYLFATTLPPGYDRRATYKIAAWTSKPLDGGTAVANAAFDFVPAGGEPQPGLAASTGACNECHAPLEAHGGARRILPLCVTCHTPQLFDPDTEDPRVPGQMNPLDMAVLVHRIHTGAELPTELAAAAAGLVGVAYHVIGYRDRDHVYAETVPPLEEGGEVRVEGVRFPQDLRNCRTCHRDAPLADHWRTVVSTRTCASCHDATWFGAASETPPLDHPHPGGPVVDDRLCATCHPPTGEEFGLSVAGAHTVPLQSEQLAGLQVDIVSVAGGAGGNPTIVFRVTNGDGSPVTDLATLNNLSATVSGPNRTYSITPAAFYPQADIVRQDVRAGAVFDAAAGTWSYAFAPRPPTDPWYPDGPVIPADAYDTWAAAMEARRAVLLAPGVTVEEAAFNPVAYFSVDGSPVTPRGTAIALARCDACHQELRAHGNLRRNPEYCVMCHSFDDTDWAVRPKGGGGNVALAGTVDGIEERSIRFSRMTHYIHTGEELEVSQPYVIYGFRGSVNYFGDVRFPGNRAICVTCHEPDTFTLDALAGAPPTIANNTGTILHDGTQAHPPDAHVIPVIQSICLSCHDTPAAHAHAAANTTDGTEACAACHGEGEALAVTRVHPGDWRR